MKHVGANNEIKAASLEALLHTRFFQVKNFIFYSGKPRQLLHGAAEKCCGNIAENVGMQIVLDGRQYVRAQAARSRSNFQDSESAALWQMFGCFLNGRGDRRQPVTGIKTFAVKLVQQFRRRPGEQDLHSVLLAAQDGAEFSAIRRAEQTFGKMS